MRYDFVREPGPLVSNESEVVYGAYSGLDNKSLISLSIFGAEFRNGLLGSDLGSL